MSSFLALRRAAAAAAVSAAAKCTTRRFIQGDTLARWWIKLTCCKFHLGSSGRVAGLAGMLKTCICIALCHARVARKPVSVFQ
jgi:hypothetical protein